MIVYPCLADLLAGLLLCNGIPHLVSGLRGESFPTPFARPHGIGTSPAIVNFLWGSLNLLVGGGLLAKFPLALGFHPTSFFFALGFLLLGVYLSRHFAAVGRHRREEIGHFTLPDARTFPPTSNLSK